MIRLPVVRTCGECAWYGKEELPDDGTGIPLDGWKRCVANEERAFVHHRGQHAITGRCEHFNAPTGLRWVPEFGDSRQGVHVHCWWIHRECDLSKSGRIGNLRPIQDGWIANYKCKPILIWKHSKDALKRCACELVARVLVEGGANG